MPDIMHFPDPLTINDFFVMDAAAQAGNIVPKIRLLRERAAISPSRMGSSLPRLPVVLTTTLRKQWLPLTIIVGI